jgi:hypothetical protein
VLAPRWPPSLVAWHAGNRRRNAAGRRAAS